MPRIVLNSAQSPNKQTNLLLRAIHGAANPAPRSDAGLRGYTVESIIGLKRGFGLIPGKLLTLK